MRIAASVKSGWVSATYVIDRFASASRGDVAADAGDANESLDKIMATDAASDAGLIAKLRAALDIQNIPAAKIAYHQDFAIAATEDAQRWLSSIGGEVRT